MSTASPRALSPTRRSGGAGPVTTTGSAPRHGVRRGLLQLLASQALVSGVGLACLPLLFRNLGAASYGQLSLFLTLLGLLASLDLARPTLVRELSLDGDGERLPELLPLIGASQGLLIPLALALGWVIFDPATAVALALGAALFVAGSAPYARLAAEGRVGLAAGVRNLGWVLAFLGATGLSFLELPAHAFAWPFVAANLGILLVNRRLAGLRGAPLGRRPVAAVWRRFRTRSLDILGLSLATAVVVSADRLLLEGCADAEAFGRYAAQYDLAIKLNVLAVALGTVLLPALSRRIATEGQERAAADFVRQTSWVALGFFALLCALLGYCEEVLGLVLGETALASAAVYPLLLAGVFLAVFGHLITPWQRACGDFRTHRRVYTLAAVLMVAVGLFAIPRWGALGAALTYLSARSADVLLVAAEAARLPRAILPAWRLVALAALALTLLAFGVQRYLALGGAA